MVYYIMTLQASVILLSIVEDVTLIKRRDKEDKSSALLTLILMTRIIVIIGDVADSLNSIYEFVQIAIKILGL